LVKDYQTSKETDLVNKTETKIDLPKSNVLQYFTADGSKISMRPSGTEPKIKFYFGVKDQLNSREEYVAVNKKLDEKIEAIIKDMKLR
jgi:phosphoglucomutase